MELTTERLQRCCAQLLRGYQAIAPWFRSDLVASQLTPESLLQVVLLAAPPSPDAERRELLFAPGLAALKTHLHLATELGYFAMAGHNPWGDHDPAAPITPELAAEVLARWRAFVTTDDGERLWLVAHGDAWLAELQLVEQLGRAHGFELPRIDLLMFDPSLPPQIRRTGLAHFDRAGNAERPNARNRAQVEALIARIDGLVRAQMTG